MYSSSQLHVVSQYELQQHVHFRCDYKKTSAAPTLVSSQPHNISDQYSSLTTHRITTPIHPTSDQYSSPNHTSCNNFMTTHHSSTKNLTTKLLNNKHMTMTYSTTAHQLASALETGPLQPSILHQNLLHPLLFSKPETFHNTLNYCPTYHNVCLLHLRRHVSSKPLDIFF